MAGGTTLMRFWFFHHVFRVGTVELSIALDSSLLFLPSLIPFNQFFLKPFRKWIVIEFFSLQIGAKA